MQWMGAGVGAGGLGMLASSRPRAAAQQEAPKIPERLAPLKETFCPIEADAMLRAAHVIVRFYRDLTVPLARTHGIPYPEALDGVMSARLEQLRTRTSS